jgi:flagellar protein FliO/FliZ
MLIALAIPRRALACAVLISAASAWGTCRGQPTGVLAQGPAGQGARYDEQSTVDPPPAAGSPAAGLPTPALPSWPDQAAESVGLRTRTGADFPATATSLDAPAPLTSTPLEDSQLRTASFPAERDRRRLGPPKDNSPPTPAERAPLADSPSVLPNLGLPLDSIYTTGTALAIVLGLFLLCVWALRRGARKSTALLPEDAVSVLGRVPLAARQFAQLVRVGNKLILLSVTPAGAETLTEITDPVEIDRLLGLCMQRKTHSTTSEFDEVFRDLAKDSAPDEILGRGSIQLATRTAYDAYAAHQGGGDRD